MATKDDPMEGSEHDVAPSPADSMASVQDNVIRRRTEKGRDGVLRKRLTVASYEVHLQRVLGKGSYGKVYMASRLGTNLRFACKMMNIDAAPVNFVQKFLPRELEVMQSLIALYNKHASKPHAVYPRLPEVAKVSLHLLGSGPLAKKGFSAPLVARPPPLHKSQFKSVTFKNQRSHVGHRWQTPPEGEAKCAHTFAAWE